MIFVTSLTHKDLTVFSKALKCIQAKAQYDMELAEFVGTHQEVAMYSGIIEAVKPLRRKILDAIKYLEQEENNAR